MNIITKTSFAGLLLLAVALPVYGQETEQSTPQLSAAMKRLRVHDSKNELYTRFRYQPLKGKTGLGINVVGMAKAQSPDGPVDQTAGANPLNFNFFPHYSTIRDVMRNPKRFNVPQDALLGKQPRRTRDE